MNRLKGSIVNASAAIKKAAPKGSTHFHAWSDGSLFDPDLRWRVLYCWGTQYPIDEPTPEAPPEGSTLVEV